MNYDFSKIKEIQIIYDDCLNVLPQIPANSIDMIFADPPYNMSKKKGLGWAFSKHITMQEAWDQFTKDEFFEFNIRWIGECLRILKSGGSIFICGSFHNIFQIGFILQQFELKILNDIIWFKPNAQPNITCRMFTQSTETVIWAAKGKKWTFNYQRIKELNNGKQMRNMWPIPYPARSERWAGKHPAQKPIALLERIILAASKPKEIILDPFLGSGTTAVVAKMLGRKCIGIEKDEEFKKIIDKRLNKVKKIDISNVKKVTLDEFLEEE